MVPRRYCIVALVPEPWAKDIDELRTQHDKWTRQWLPPHITIVAPFYASLSREAVRAIEEAPVDIKVRLGGWGIFPHDRSDTLWIEAGDMSTKDAPARLAAAVPELTQVMTQPPIDWTKPSSHHVTVVNRVPKEVTPTLEPELRKIDIEGEFHVPHLTVFSWDSRIGQWLRARME